MDFDQLRKHLEREKNLIFDYFTASERFKRFSNTISPKEETVEYYSNLITKFCIKHMLDVEVNEFSVDEFSTDLFYDLIRYSDYLQIKAEHIPALYTELTGIIISSGLVRDVIQKLPLLSKQSHLKVYILRGLLVNCQLEPKLEKDYLTFTHLPTKTNWTNLLLKDTKTIKINSTLFSGFYRFWDSGLPFELLLRLTAVENLTLNECSLNRRNIEKLLSELNLKTLRISKCGSCVNRLFSDEFIDGMKNLKELDISENALPQSTLENIKKIPLKCLNIRKSIRKNEIFVPNFDTENEAESSWLFDGELDETLEILIATIDDIPNRFEITKFKNLKELRIDGFFKVKNYITTFPNTLTTLILPNSSFEFNDFRKLCAVPIEKLHFIYEGSADDDFFMLENSKLAKSLKELSGKILNFQENFMVFIANLKLTHFACDCVSNEFVDSIIVEPAEKRKYLKSLHLSGIDLYITPLLLDGLGALNLTELCIGIEGEVWEILSLENIRESVETLILKRQKARDEELFKIAKFKKLHSLEISYTTDVSSILLFDILKLSTLKIIKAEATIEEPLDSEGVQALSSLPTHKLIVECECITKCGYEYLTQNKSNRDHFCGFGKILVLRRKIPLPLAKILGMHNWETIICESVQDESFDLIMSNRFTTYSLQCLRVEPESNWNWKLIELCAITELKIWSHNGKFPEELLDILKTDNPLIKFLRSISCFPSDYSPEYDEIFQRIQLSEFNGKTYLY